MAENSEVSGMEQAFFAALLGGSGEKLEEILTEDFLLIDVMSGSEIGKAMLVAAVGMGQLRFARIEQMESRVRHYGAAAVVTGRTQMGGSFGGAAFATKSRYTHVYVQQGAAWRLASAQGTQITGE